MKRFYQAATVMPSPEGFAILLDGKPVRTPGRSPLAVPSEQLANAIAEEWNSQEEKIDPRAMPQTGLANAAIDRVALDTDAFAKALAAYGETDLLYYRADGPRSLVDRQARLWDPALDWARRRYDIDFAVVTGVMHRPQPANTVDQLTQAVFARNPFELAGLSPLVTVSGSLIIALALAEGAMDLEEAWSAATADEQAQAEQWGEDPEAARALAARRRDFEAGARFLALL